MTTDQRDAGGPGWVARVGWLILIWLAGVAALGLVAGILRVLMAWAGLRR